MYRVYTSSMIKFFFIAIVQRNTFPRYPRYLTDLGHFNYFSYDGDIKYYIASSGNMSFDNFTGQTHSFNR
jgi:hypothetical protein